MNQRPRDIWFWTWSTVSRSTNWAIGGWYLFEQQVIIYSWQRGQLSFYASEILNGYLLTVLTGNYFGGLAQMVERSICIREAPGSIPGFSIFLLHDHNEGPRIELFSFRPSNKLWIFFFWDDAIDLYTRIVGMYDVFRKKSLFAGSILGRVIFCTHHVIHTWCVYYIATKNIVCSREWFRSTDLWVMGPARFLCATLLIILVSMIGSILESLSELVNRQTSQWKVPEIWQKYCPVWGSNSRPSDYETDALPTALTRLMKFGKRDGCDCGKTFSR